MGHRLEDVGGYTFDQVELFLGAAARIEKEDARLGMIVARGSQADEKGFKRLMKEFS
ncbi:MAG: hypothetical protein KJ989_15245 [Gammaproteobacteria bacterium]|uniref:Uncharacterized protein n=1 Tax=viral metagenome TaxID=1070528 RepID=A0A6M3KDK8_9ZZZZ|nr:hypothetical protein [Gammaproteobacteria bacterium]MBU2067473.1 hypothetical protein [Gammaproteobacteria bacterium]MBU2139483.1 hypothetical protein [Gammaproteobacteria bacterium]MBU2255910.1 hypothetical protein [Gammaproteobacteria bacterium]MBU2295555.1 hypothetical protein [Gammaproteobacteria bacterium]